MLEHQPERRSNESRESGAIHTERTPNSTDPVATPPRTPEEQAALEATQKKLAEHTKKADDHGHGGGGGGGHHGHEKPWVTWGVKQPFAIFGYFFSLAWQGLKRWGEMAQKGGGGGAKKKDDDHGH